MDAEVAPTIDQAALVDLAKGICRIPSPLGGEGLLAAYVAGELERRGFEVELQEVVAGRPNVVAIARGDPARQSFVFNGHLDVPPPFGAWRRDPFDPWIEDGVLYGAGIQDMKGGVAALIEGAAAAVRAAPDGRGDVVVTAVMHHDTTGVGTKHFLASTEWRLDAGVCGEPTDLKVQICHGGAWAWEVELCGVPRHQSRLEEGVNAIGGMLRVLDRFDVAALSFESDPRYPHLPRIVVGTIEGGGMTSTTAERCLARGDVRFLPSMTIDGMKADLRRVVDGVCAEMPGLSGRVRTFARQWPYEIDAEAPVVRALVAAHERVTDAPPELTTGLPAGAFITDAADMVRHGIPTVLYGPGDWRTAPDEGIPIRDLVTAAEVYAATCLDVIGRPRG